MARNAGPSASGGGVGGKQTAGRDPLLDRLGCPGHADNVRGGKCYQGNLLVERTPKQKPKDRMKGVA